MTREPIEPTHVYPKKKSPTDRVRNTTNKAKHGVGWGMEKVAVTASKTIGGAGRWVEKSVREGKLDKAINQTQSTLEKLGKSARDRLN